MSKDIQPALIPLWPDTAKLLNISRPSVYKAAARGEIDTVTIGGKIQAVRSKLNEKLGIKD